VQQAAITRRRSCSTTTSRSQEHQHQHQVVVLKVSLHCKGCAGKVKKHISKMEGVTSFDTDVATKKVTVMGDVAPLGVLNCISKVKSAQFWPPRAFASF
jgi:copper chaperone CopZ